MYELVKVKTDNGYLFATVIGSKDGKYQIQYNNNAACVAGSGELEHFISKDSAEMVSWEDILSCDIELYCKGLKDAGFYSKECGTGIVTKYLKGVKSYLKILSYVTETINDDKLELNIMIPDESSSTVYINRNIGCRIPYKEYKTILAEMEKEHNCIELDTCDYKDKTICIRIHRNMNLNLTGQDALIKNVKKVIELAEKIENCNFKMEG